MAKENKDKCHWCKKKAEYKGHFNFGVLEACEEHKFNFALVAHLQPPRRIKVKMDKKDWENIVVSEGAC